jgi:hypothetical protein
MQAVQLDLEEAVTLLAVLPRPMFRDQEKPALEMTG